MQQVQPKNQYNNDMGWLILPIVGLITFLVVLLYQRILFSHFAPLTKLLLFSLLTFILMLSAFIKVQGAEEGTLESTILTPIAAPIQKSIETYRNITRSRELEKIVQDSLHNEDGTYAVAIKNLKTGEEYYLNETRKFSSASLYKLWTMGTVYQQVEDGKLTFDRTVSMDIAELNRIFDLGEDAEQTEGTITRTVREAVDQMITISHNYSALLLTYTVKNSSVKQFLLDNHLTASNTGSPPQTTAKDTADYYEKLYRGQLVSTSASKEMIEVLKRQQLNDRIPKYLPKGTVVAHKTGELGAVKHDAGIVFSSTGDYIIVLLSETSSQAHAAEVEAKLSQKVWEYFHR